MFITFRHGIFDDEAYEAIMKMAEQEEFREF